MIASAAARPAQRQQVRQALLELIAALDRRVQQRRRSGERAIAHDSGELRQEAVMRLATLEREGLRAAEVAGLGELAAPAND